MIVCTGRSVPAVFGPARWTVRPWWNATDPFGTSTNTGSMPVTSGSVRMSCGSPKKMLTNFRSPTVCEPGRYAMAPDSSVDPSNGTHAVTDAVSLIGQYGWSWCG